MKWLVWKEYRLNRSIVIVGATLLVVPHLVALILAWYDAGPLIQGGMPRLWQNLVLSAGYSLVLSQLTLALLGGHAIACERVDRSAEFLAYLPLARARILAGKITLPILAAALIWGLNLLILLFIIPDLWLSEARGPEVAREVLGVAALTGFVFFCVGWLLSSLLESPSFATCGGLITPFLIATGIQALAWLFEYPLERVLQEVIGPWYVYTCLVLAPACFVAGTWCYLRRVEP